METIHEFEFSSAASFTFSPDGTKLYGTSYFTGASNIFRFDVATHAMEVLTNTETGLFWPRLLPDGRLLAFEYTAKGFYPVLVQDPKPLEDVSAVRYFGQQVVEKYPQVRGLEASTAGGNRCRRAHHQSWRIQALPQFTIANVHCIRSCES